MLETLVWGEGAWASGSARAGPRIRRRMRAKLRPWKREEPLKRFLLPRSRHSGDRLCDGLRCGAELVDVVTEQGPVGADEDHVDAVESDGDIALGVFFSSHMAASSSNCSRVRLPWLNPPSSWLVAVTSM